LKYPGNTRFAFTILDDTDDARVENVKPIYDLLAGLGMRTTKTVWPVACPEGSREFFAGHTMADPEDLAFCQDLQRRGFEITWHGATMESSRRQRTVEALEAFRKFFGRYPSLHANHALNRENVYWGARRYQTFVRLIARVFRPGGDQPFEGDREGSDWFWGDLCAAHFRYVRNFTFRQINTLRADPHTPYRLPSTPYANMWFSGSDAPNADAAAALVTPASLDRLCAEGGACILTTHLGKGFVANGVVDPRVELALRHAASLPGWFVPVSELLDYLVEQGAGQAMSYMQLLALETRHALDRLMPAPRG
jgi:hypothetical protein